MIKAPPAHSYSRLSCHAACPLQYKRQYIEKQKTAPADPLILGAAAHDFFEAYANHCQKNKLETDMATFPAIAKDVLLAQEHPLPEHLIGRYNDLCRKHVEMEMMNLDTLSGVELEITFDKNWNLCSWFSPHAALRMKLDRLHIDGDLADITDYKTGYGEGNTFQMENYAAGIFMRSPEINRCNTKFAYVDSGHVAQMEFGRDRLPELVEKIEEKCARVSEDKKYEPTPGAACQYCPFVGTCTAKPSALAVVTNSKEALQVAEDLFVLEAQVKAKKEALKGYVVGHGDVETKAGRYGFSKTETISVRDMEALKGVFELKGLDLMPHLSITGTELKKLYKKNDGLEEDVKPLLDIKVSETFKGMKLKKEEVEG